MLVAYIIVTSVMAAILGVAAAHETIKNGKRAENDED